MHNWRLMLLATGCQLAVSLLPCAAWPWLLPDERLRSAQIAIVVCLGFVVIGALWCEALATRGRDDVRSGDARQGLVGAQLTGLTVLLVIWCGLVELRLRHSLVAWPIVAGGICIALLGIALRSSAIAALGSDFQTIHRLAAPDRLQTTGLYAWIRHPSETGLLLFAIGCALLLHSGVAAMLVLTLLLPLVILRLKAEEVVLRQVCGAAHEEYCRRTPLLVPRLIRR
jgi:protein-S-isoprenylcysteine O-methyltransferase Ste14